LNFQGDGIHHISNLEFRDCSSNQFGSVIGAGLVAATSVGASLEIDNCYFYNIAHNAIRFSPNGVQAAPRAKITNCVFDNIGEDAIYGCALYYEVAYCTIRNVSMRTETGDGVGFLGCNPTLAWVHHNSIDHTSTDFKHCVIIDGVDGSGYALVEHNILRGITTTCVNFNNVRGTARNNYIETSGIAFSSNTANAQYISNYIVVNGFRTDAATMGLAANNALVLNNTFIIKSTAGRVIDSGTSTTGTNIKNNLILGGDIFYKRGGSATDTLDYNGFKGTISPYVDSSFIPIALSSNDLSSVTSLTTLGLLKESSNAKYVGSYTTSSLDKEGKLYHNPPSLGAYEYIPVRGTR